MSLTSFASSFIFTTFLLQWWLRPSYPPTLWLSIGCLGFIGCFGYLHHAWKRKTTLLLSCILAISLALWNIARTEQSIMTSLEHLPMGTKLQMEGMVTGLPESRQGTITYIIELRTIANEQKRLPANGKITVRTRDIRARFVHGDMVNIDGNIERIPHPYEKYLRAQSILGSISYATITRTGKREGSILIRALARWNNAVSARIRDLFSEPEASLLTGLLLGKRGGFSRETLTAFQTAGLTHILAISGYNITLLLIAISILLTRLPSILRLIVALTGVTLFTLFVGASPSAVRAAVMGSIGLIALHSRHLPETRRIILWTACLMLLWNPLQLWWDASFQLSFLAVIGITDLQPILKKILQNIPEYFGIRETLIVTLAAQCTALPWAAALFGNVALLSPIANILVAPAIPFIMFMGPLALIGGTVHDLLGRILAFPCWIVLQWIIRVTETIALFPMVSIQFPQQTLLPLLVYYTALLLFLQHKKAPTTPVHPTPWEED